MVNGKGAKTMYETLSAELADTLGKARSGLVNRNLCDKDRNDIVKQVDEVLERFKEIAEE